MFIEPHLWSMGQIPSPTPSERRSALRIAGTSVVGVTFFAQDVVGLLEQSGLWSVVSGLQAAGAHARIIDLDSAGLRSTITAMNGLVLVAAFSLLNVDIRRRWPAIFVLLSMVIGSLTLDALMDGPIIERLMATRRYRRNLSGDHATGSGRNKVCFNQFVAILPARGATRMPA